MRKIILDMEEDFEEDVYSEDYREVLMDNDEVTPEEDAFMRGYEEAG